MQQVIDFIMICLAILACLFTMLLYCYETCKCAPCRLCVHPESMSESVILIHRLGRLLDSCGTNVSFKKFCVPKHGKDL